MNIKILLILTLILNTSILLAQRFQIGAMMGYQLGAIVDGTEQDQGTVHPGPGLGVSAAVNYGFLADINLGSKVILELSWDQQPSRLNFHNGETKEVTKLTDIKVQYYQAGLLYSWSPGTFKPFVGGTVGFTNMIPSGDYQKETRFSAGPIVGFTTYASKYFGIRFQTRVLITNMPSGDLFANSSGESLYSHHKSTFATQIQFGIGIVSGF
jgi:hypothetical protein